MFSLINKTAIITGGASGIGLAIARLFAEQGAFVHILEMNADSAEREADLIVAAGATHLLLDNMDVATLREAVALVDGRVPTEASGGITLEAIRAKAETGVTYLSVGRLTQSAPAADIGLDFTTA